jgi:hypothetical protein
MISGRTSEISVLFDERIVFGNSRFVVLEPASPLRGGDRVLERALDDTRDVEVERLGAPHEVGAE